MVDRLLGRPRDREVAPTPAPPPPVDPRDAVWARVQLARNPRRPHTLELVSQITDSFVELHGDRLFGDDGAIVGGPARIDGRRVMIVGHQKGADTDENIRRNFGMGKPEGFRKAIRLFELADRLGLPVVTFVDTPGAYPGAEAEERGIADAIACSIGAMCRLRVPDRHADHRRRRLGRRAGDRRRGRGGRPGERRLLGDQPGRVRFHPLAHERQGAGRRARDADERRRTRPSWA